MSERLIMHIDMDAFFAAIEQRDDPSLVGKPVIIGALPGKRGVVSTCSYEARVFGIHSAMPISEAFRRCPQGVYLKPNGPAIREASHLIVETLRGISPVVEPVSVDEAYVDISGLERLIGPPDVIGRLAKQRIREATRLSSSVGIGPNRLIAKLASDAHKPDGLTIIRADQVQAFLYPMPVENMRGVGKHSAESLKRRGIHTIATLRTWSEERLIAVFGDASGRMLYRQARGIWSDHVGEHESRKSISKEHTFNEDCCDPETLRQTMLELAADVARTARREGLTGRGIRLKLRLDGFETHTRSTTLAHPTNLDDVIFKEGWRLYSTSAFCSRPVRLIGIGIFDWSAPVQLDLFDKPNERKIRLAGAKDDIVARFGKSILGIKKAK
jgi:DNA polymerase-4